MKTKRKNTSEIVSTWRNYLSGKKTNFESDKFQTLNENNYLPKDKNECLDALHSELVECGWDDERITALTSALYKCSISNESLDVICYGANSSDTLNNDRDLGSNYVEDDPLEIED
jgi:hypothetical protein